LEQAEDTAFDWHLYMKLLNYLYENIHLVMRFSHEELENKMIYDL